MKYLLTILSIITIVSCDSPTNLEAPKPCAEYELVYMYADTAVFEKDISISINVSDYEGDLEEGQMYTLCGGGGQITIK